MNTRDSDIGLWTQIPKVRIPAITWDVYTESGKWDNVNVISVTIKIKKKQMLEKQNLCKQSKIVVDRGWGRGAWGMMVLRIQFQFHNKTRVTRMIGG